MKAALSLTLLALSLPSTALADGPRCENSRLMKTLAQMMGGLELEVTSTAKQVTVANKSDLVLTVTCDAIDIPLASRLERPSRGPSRTLQVQAVTVSRTARGAVSLDIAAGALQREAVQVLLLDDQSVSLTRGKETLYAQATLPDGTVVVTEGRGVGCGCVKTTTPDGKTSTRPL
jgi:hypothetical protein